MEQKLTEHVSGAMVRRIPSIRVNFRIPFDMQAFAIQYLSPGTHLYQHDFDSLCSILNRPQTAVYADVVKLACLMRRRGIRENVRVFEPIWVYPPDDAMGRLEREMKGLMKILFITDLYSVEDAVEERA